MGNVIRFPRARHGRASVDSNPNSVGAASLSMRRRASEKIINFSGGMRPRARQLLTADKPTAAKAATSDVPPSASTTASTVVSIDSEYSHIVNESSLHDLQIFTNCELRSNGDVARSQKDIAYRLELTREALKVSPAKLCQDTGLGANQWSQFVNPDGDRRITIDAVYRLKDEYGVTFDWVYDGSRKSLHAGLLDKIRRIERRGGINLHRTRGRRPLAKAD